MTDPLSARTPQPGRRVTILGLMALVAAVALGLWLVLPEVRELMLMARDLIGMLDWP